MITRMAPKALVSSACRWLSVSTVMPGSEMNRSGWVEISQMSAGFVIAQKDSKPSGSQ